MRGVSLCPVCSSPTVDRVREPSVCKLVCWDCGFTVTGSTGEEARARWNRESDFTSPGVHRISRERRRQVVDEGWSSELDDEHHCGEMAAAAAAYALRTAGQAKAALGVWPWDSEWWKPGDCGDAQGCVRALEKAGALIAAEIDRLLRMERAASE